MGGLPSSDWMPGKKGASVSPATTVTGPDASGAPAVVGTSLLYARQDHDHGLPTIPAAVSPATTVTGPDAFGASAVVGTSALYARGDHDHGLPTQRAPATTVTGPDAFGASAVVGTSLLFARQDHDHGLPADGVTGVSNSDGTLTISPTTGAVVASIALGHANSWSGNQTFGNHISVGGALFNVSSLSTWNRLYYDGTNWINKTPASLYVGVGSKNVATLTANGQYVGLGAAGATISKVTGTMLDVTICGVMNLPAASGFTSTIVDAYFGTGSAPANGGTVPGSGTAVGTQGLKVVTGTVTGAEALSVPYSMRFLITGLTAGNTYWLDLAAKGSAATTWTLTNNGVTAVDLS